MEGDGRARWLLLRMLLGALIVTVLSGGAVAAAGLLEFERIKDDLVEHGTEAPMRPGTITKAESGKPQTILLAALTGTMPQPPTRGVGRVCRER